MLVLSNKQDISRHDKSEQKKNAKQNKHLSISSCLSIWNDVVLNLKDQDLTIIKSYVKKIHFINNYRCRLVAYLKQVKAEV